MSETKTLQVMYDEKLVGTLAMASGHKVDSSIVRNG